MTITLPKEVLDSLPAPDSGGIIRVTAGLKVNPDSGDAEVVEIEDHPLPMGDEAESTDDKNPAPAESLPDLSQIPSAA